MFANLYVNIINKSIVMLIFEDYLNVLYIVYQKVIISTIVVINIVIELIIFANITIYNESLIF